MTKQCTTLVVHSGGIGDLILCCPSIAHLATQGPVDLLGHPDRVQLAVAGGIARTAYDLDRVDFASLYATPSVRLKTFLTSYDRAVVWLRDPGEIENAFRDAGIADVHCFAGIPPQAWKGHASEYYLDCIHAPPQPPVHLSVQPGKVAHDVLIHPGSGGSKKNWPTANYAALSAALIERGRNVTWCLGPAEEDLVTPIRANVLRCTSLAELAGHLANAALYVGNDAGITHLAAAVGCATIALFGPTDPTVWAPQGEHVTVLRGTPWPEVEAVLKQITCPIVE